jgi:hypothetical protein
MALMEKPQRKAWMALPSVAKGRFRFWPPLPRISGEQSPKLSRIYPRTKKNCIVFLLLPNNLVSLSTGSVCLISHGVLVVDEIEVLVYNNLLESSHFLWRSVLSRNSRHGRTSRNELLLWMATIWAMAACVILSIYFILVFNYCRVMFGSTLQSVES